MNVGAAADGAPSAEKARLGGQANFAGLDGARGLLSIVVCFAHAFTILVRPSHHTKEFSHYFWVISSRYAVLAFFVLSGFVIALSVQRNSKRNGVFRLGDFAASRAARILPPLLAAIGLTMVLAALLSFLGLQDLPPGTPSERDAFRVDYVAQVSSLLTFGLAGQLSGGLNGPLWLPPMGRLTGLASALFLASAAALAVGDIDNLDRTFFALLSQTLFGLMFAACVAIIVRTRFLSPLAPAGGFSYSLYIVHYPLLLFLYLWLQPLSRPWFTWALGVPLALMVAMALAPWVEDAASWRRRLHI